jgi:hypothetical protein
LRREVNDRMLEISRNWDRHVMNGRDTSFAVLCECGGAGCQERIELHLGEYEQIRSDSTLFVLAPGHRATGDEVEVERADRYLILRDGRARPLPQP